MPAAKPEWKSGQALADWNALGGFAPLDAYRPEGQAWRTSQTGDDLNGRRRPTSNQKRPQEDRPRGAHRHDHRAALGEVVFDHAEQIDRYRLVIAGLTKRGQQRIRKPFVYGSLPGRQDFYFLPAAAAGSRSDLETGWRQRLQPPLTRISQEPA
jgi:hypothetical protein